MVFLHGKLCGDFAKSTLYCGQIAILPLFVVMGQNAQKCLLKTVKNGNKTNFLLQCIYYNIKSFFLQARF